MRRGRPGGPPPPTISPVAKDEPFLPPPPIPPKKRLSPPTPKFQPKVDTTSYPPPSVQVPKINKTEEDVEIVGQTTLEERNRRGFANAIDLDDDRESSRGVRQDRKETSPLRDRPKLTDDELTDEEFEDEPLPDGKYWVPRGTGDDGGNTVDPRRFEANVSKAKVQFRADPNLGGFKNKVASVTDEELEQMAREASLAVQQLPPIDISVPTRNEVERRAQEEFDAMRLSLTQRFREYTDGEVIGEKREETLRYSQTENRRTERAEQILRDTDRRVEEQKRRQELTSMEMEGSTIAPPNPFAGINL